MCGIDDKRAIIGEGTLRMRKGLKSKAYEREVGNVTLNAYVHSYVRHEQFVGVQIICFGCKFGFSGCNSVLQSRVSLGNLGDDLPTEVGG